ncbi:lysozyme [Pasteurella multocida]|uniref:lysozyme n=1 Tax=Pasteurella multocida TaxID=747 RepID=UPI00224DC9D3|nr:lysozyme [Pasteurella multocida]UZT13795.1 lysozyme [Pasteurella multocida]UZT16357.1 lysozyme [Pasteurella multocida]UZU32410.1 lysozyme [Pasteurella multocida]UZU37067.1 lysozyme [Pasteurella multocida]WAE38290.1 lysozyme [Pasteurella multocida]
MKHVKKITACSVAMIIAVVMSDHSTEIRTGERGLEIIGNAEGCAREPYRCPADVLTVGIGSTELSGLPIDRKRYSDEEIAKRWINDIKVAKKCVNNWANGNNLPQGAFEATVSITFNVGCSKLKYSTLFKHAKNGDIQAMCDQFPRWKYANGKVLRGLEIRRQKERELCLADLHKS